MTRLEDTDDILRWIKSEAGGGSTVIGVDAPLVICNRTGIRDAERELNSEFRRYHAGSHAANLGRPFARNVLSFSRRLTDLGFCHGADITVRQGGCCQIEVHPHAATVNLFDPHRIVKYKRGRRAERAKGLNRLRELMLSRLPLLDSALSLRLPSVPTTGNLKPVEDEIDAVLCAPRWPDPDVGTYVGRHHFHRLRPGIRHHWPARAFLVLMGRLLQGFSAGMELGGVSVYLSEIATRAKRLSTTV